MTHLGRQGLALLLVLLLALLLGLACIACEDEPVTAPPSEPSAAEAAPTEEPGDVAVPAEPEPDPDPVDACRLTSLELSFARQTREARFEYEGERIARFELQVGRRAQSGAYEYDEEGRVVSASLGRSTTSYTYEGQRLVETRTGAQRRVFSYDDSGRIVRQETKHRGRVFGAIDYTYGEGPCPSTATITNARGTTTGAHALAYDQSPNPLAGLGPLVNAVDTLFGHPVGDCANNLTADEVTNAAGETTERAISVAYEGGWPTSIDIAGDTLTFSYACEGQSAGD